jgi:hypothetical protein
MSAEAIALGRRPNVCPNMHRWLMAIKRERIRTGLWETVLSEWLLGLPSVLLRFARDALSADTLSASSHASRTLRLTERRAEWQVSWGFLSRPAD